MPRLSFLRTGVAALHLMPIAAVAIPLSPASATTAPVSAENFDWRGIFLMSSDSDTGQRTYIQLSNSPTSSLSAATVWSWNGGTVEQRGTILFDQSQSTPLALVGRYRRTNTDPGSMMTMQPFAGNQNAVVLIDQGGTRKPSYLRRVSEIGAVAEPSSGTSLQNAVTGTWDTTLGTLKIWRSGDGTYGEVTKPGSTTPLHSIVLRSVRGEYMIWTSRKSSEERFEMIMSPDDQRFEAYVPATFAPIGSRNWSGRRSSAAVPQPAPGAPPASAGPKPGYTSCEDWCETKILSSKIVNLPVEGGKLAPMLLLDVAVHNKTGQTRTLQPFFIGTETVTFVGSAGTFDHSKPALTSDGPMNMTTNAAPGKWPYVMQAIGLAPGAEVRVTHVLGGKPIPQNLDRLLLVYQGDKGSTARRTDVAGGQEVLCALYQAEQRLKAADALAYAVDGLPAQCGGSSTPAPEPQPAPAPVPPSPVTPPPPVVAQPPLPMPGTMPPGVFHSLQRFDLRMDEIRAGRDGKVHLLVTVANKSGAPRSVGQSSLSMVMTDADGVGIYTGTPYRADGEELQNYNVPPTIAAGSELKLRYVMEPPVVHGPIRRIGVRESDVKILFFDASVADTASIAAGAPPTSSGSFKPLSKLDVRIDRAGGARDGRFEAFLTFRNPTRQPQSVNAAEQRLSGTNSDGSPVSARYALYSIRGERGENDALPVPVYVEAGSEIRVRYVFDDAPTGTLKITDGTATQTFTPGG